MMKSFSFFTLLFLLALPLPSFSREIDPSILNHCDLMAEDDWYLKKLCILQQEQAKSYFDSRQ
jgi:hypothetical protein